MSIACPTCYVNSVPEAIPVTVYNQVITAALGDDVKWIHAEYVVADSVNQAGYRFLIKDSLGNEYVLADAGQLQVLVDSVDQDPATFTIAADGTYFQLVTALEADQKVRVHALVYILPE